MNFSRSGQARGALAAVAVTAATVFLGLTAAGCSGDPQIEGLGPVGSAELSLVLPESTSFQTLSFKISHSNGYLNEGSVPVANSQTITFQIGNIPAATGYSMALSATAASTEACTGGPVPFDIKAGETALIAITLHCGQGTGVKSGNVRVDVDVQQGGGSCPLVDGLTALPRSVNVGGVINLHGYATANNATYAWTVEPVAGGTFSSASAQMTGFTCATAGTHKVTLAVSGGASCTPSKADVPLICTTPGGGESGAGAGGAGAGGAGAGGAGAGGAGAGGAGAGGAGAGGAGAGGAGAGGAGAGGAGAGGAGAGGAGAGGTGGGSSAGCQACRTQHCADYMGSGYDLYSGCFVAINAELGAPAGDPTFLQQCMDAVKCGFDNNCAYGKDGLSECYCGTGRTPDDCIAMGPTADAKCIEPIKAAARAAAATANKDVTDRMSELAYPLGWAYFLLECDRDNCATAAEGDCTPVAHNPDRTAVTQ